MSVAGSTRPPHDAVEPDHPMKPESPTDIKGRSWLFALRRTARQFSRDQCTDMAAALTYYAVLSIFPAAIVTLSLVGVFGQGQQTVDALLGILQDVGADSVANAVEPTLQSLSTASGQAGIALVLGLAAALWSASGYVGAFGRAMNRIYAFDEGRPFWKLRPWMLGVTVVLMVLSVLVLLGLVLTGPAASAVGDALGLESAVVTVWSIAKWPAILLAVTAIVAILYYATPNVRQPRFRWLSVGAALAIVTWVVASVAFGFYVANFSSYDKTYGALAGVIVFLLWMWITNLALLFGAELDSELERARELQAGLPAEQDILLPHRDTRNVEKAARQEQQEVAQARKLRDSEADPRSTDQVREPAHEK